VERTRQPKQLLKEWLFITAKSHAPSLHNANDEIGARNFATPKTWWPPRGW
jgi:hypothetical protein